MKKFEFLSNSIHIIKLALTGAKNLPTVNKAEFLNPKDVQNHLSPDDPVVGLEINGEARAYPIKWVREQQVIADVAGSKTIVLTYCEDSKKAAAFIIETNPHALRKVAAPLQEQSIVLNDSNRRQLIEETTGEIIFGPDKGSQFPALPVRIVPWVTWATLQPDSKVMYFEQVQPAALANSPSKRIFVQVREFATRGLRIGLALSQLVAQN